MKFEIDNIELDFDGKPILTGVYLKAETGKITDILGANGTGKSSLLKIFFGNLQPTHKLIRIDSKPFLPPLFGSGLVKFLPQHSIIPKHLQLQKAFDLFQLGWPQFVEVFPEFAAYQKYKIHQLSGGELRIVEIYLILKSPGELTLLDEPFSHIAPVFIERFLKIFQEEKPRKAIVMTDHMYRHIIEVADELYLLKNGCSQNIRSLTELEDYRYLKADML